jgi:hypothetical protein
MVLRATAVASHTAATRRQCLACRNQPPPALVEKRRDGRKPRLNGGDIDHRLKIPTPPLPEYLYLDSFIAFCTQS